MPEIPDRSLSTPAPAPQGVTNGAAPAVEKPADSSKPPKQGPSPYEQRIEQLVREKYEMKSKFEQASARLEALASEVESLKSSRAVEPRPNGHLPTSVQEYPDQDLHQIIAKGAEANPDGFVLAIQELQRRAAVNATKGVSEQTQRQIQLEAERQQVKSQVVNTFGQQAWRTDTDLYQKADSIYGQMIAEAQQKFGREQGLAYIQSMPSLQMRCFELADRELRARELEELPELRRRAERLKQVEALQSGIGAPVQRDQAFQDALKRRDRRAIFENLPIVKGIRE